MLKEQKEKNDIKKTLLILLGGLVLSSCGTLNS